MRLLLAGLLLAACSADPIAAPERVRCATGQEAFYSETDGRGAVSLELHYCLDARPEVQALVLHLLATPASGMQ